MDLLFRPGRTILRCSRPFNSIARVPSDLPLSTTVRSPNKHGIDGLPTDRLAIALAPEYPLSTQLRQATTAVKNLRDKGISPSNIILAGDCRRLQLAALLSRPHQLLPLPPRLDPQCDNASPSSSASQQPFGSLLFLGLRRIRIRHKHALICPK